MGISAWWHWVVLGLVVLLLFGKGRFSDLMGDVAKGIKSFKKGMAEDETTSSAAKPQARIDAQEAARPASETVVHHDEKTPR